MSFATLLKTDHQSDKDLIDLAFSPIWSCDIKELLFLFKRILGQFFLLRQRYITLQSCPFLIMLLKFFSGVVNTD